MIENSSPSGRRSSHSSVAPACAGTAIWLPASSSVTRARTILFLGRIRSPSLGLIVLSILPQVIRRLHGLLPRSFAVDKNAPQDFSRGRFWNFIRELDKANALVRCDTAANKLENLVPLDRSSLGHVGFGEFCGLRI